MKSGDRDRGAVEHPRSVPPIVLASASPRRTALLSEWGIPHDIESSDVDETFAEGVPAEEQARVLAARKAASVHERLGRRRFVLAADTIVATDSRLLAKPESIDDAVAMLMELSGRRILVITGVALARPEAEMLVEAEVTTLEMRPFDRAEARVYAETGEPLGKAGAFAIQGRGAALIAARDGSYSNVVGLPRGLVLSLLKRSGLPFPAL